MQRISNQLRINKELWGGGGGRDTLTLMHPFKVKTRKNLCKLTEGDDLLM